MYADDAAVLVSCTNIEQVQSLLSREIETVSEWLIGNKLSLHLGRTESTLFGSKSMLKSQSNMTISCHTNRDQNSGPVPRCYFGSDSVLWVNDPIYYTES